MISASQGGDSAASSLSSSSSAPLPSPGYLSQLSLDNISIRFSHLYLLLTICLKGLKCKECKFRCHTQCEVSVPPSCGLPEQVDIIIIIIIIIISITNSGNPSLQRILPPIINSAPFDSSSSSCNRSEILYSNIWFFLSVLFTYLSNPARPLK